MGNEESSNARRSYNKEEPKLSKKEVQQLLNAQRREYEKKCQELVNQAQSRQNEEGKSPQVGDGGAASLERQRAPYGFTRDELQNATLASTAAHSNLYPNLKTNHPGTSGAPQTVHTYDFTNYVTKPSQDFEFVNNNGQVERPLPSAPPQHFASPQRAAPRPPQPKPRDRSVSKTRYQSNEPELNCPTCKTMFGLQIFQCSSGHSSCKTCKESGRPCGICHNEITSMRNHTLESYIAETKVPCPNKDDGCMLSIKLADVKLHVKECPFNELQCPLGCYWKGKLKQLCVHFDAMHPEQRSADVGSEIHLQKLNTYGYEYQNLYLVLIGAYNFLFHVKASESESKIYMATQLIGTKMSASKWSYEVHIYNKSECRRKYVYTDNCTSFQEPLTNIFNEGRCSVMPHSYASTFANNGVLTFKIFIKKSFDDKNRRGNFRNHRGKN